MNKRKKQMVALIAPIVIALSWFAHQAKADELPEPVNTDVENSTSTSPGIEPPAPADQITLIIRDGSVTAFSEPVELPGLSAPDVQVMPSNASTTVNVSARSVLGVLETLQASSTAFKITDASYSATFKSFLINCIAVPAAAPVPDCFNWTDAINGIYPQVGADHQLLENGDVVVLFFGPSHKAVLSKSAVSAGEQFTATAQQYDLPTGEYQALTGVTLGVGTANSDFTFTELATSTVDSSGQAVFTINTPGTFSVGIQEEYYFPAATLTVTDAPPSGGGGGGGGISHLNLNINTALAFISKNQNPDGSFESDLTSDWTALAFAAADPGSAKDKLRTYLLGAKPQMSFITDYERHAMALLALNINPYSGTSIDYVTPIVNAFDGTQIGISGDNDDVFALVVLQHAGYTSADEIIQKEAAFVLSAQKTDGSWDESADMTAAATQALGPLYNLPGVNQALGKAAGYLKSVQLTGGGWDNVDSTSWAQTAINGMIETHTPQLGSESAWASGGGLYPTDALAKSQSADGGVESSSRVWSTAYAVTAASGRSWFTILNNFSKPATLGSENLSGGAGLSSAASTTATSTLVILPIAVSTSTPATSTSAVINAVDVTNTATSASKTIAAPKAKVIKQTGNIKPKVLGATTVSHTDFFTRLRMSITFFFSILF